VRLIIVDNCKDKKGNGPIKPPTSARQGSSEDHGPLIDHWYKRGKSVEEIVEELCIAGIQVT
jgi:hypothetical protein